ncbi:MAG: hypothetical protein ACRC9X_01010 [Bacteroidales bacterium]
MRTITIDRILTDEEIDKIALDNGINVVILVSTSNGKTTIQGV